jgi:hypothetical protein
LSPKNAASAWHPWTWNNAALYLGAVRRSVTWSALCARPAWDRAAAHSVEALGTRPDHRDHQLLGLSSWKMVVVKRGPREKHHSTESCGLIYAVIKYS